MQECKYASILNQNFFDPNLTWPKLFQTEHTLRLAHLPSFCELVLCFRADNHFWSTEWRVNDAIIKSLINYANLSCTFILLICLINWAEHAKPLRWSFTLFLCFRADTHFWSTEWKLNDATMKSLLCRYRLDIYPALLLCIYCKLIHCKSILLSAHMSDLLFIDFRYIYWTLIHWASILLSAHMSD